MSLSSFDIALARLLSGRLTQEIDTKRGQLEEGFPDDFAKYREQVGELRGLKAALAILEETKEALIKD